MWLLWVYQNIFKVDERWFDNSQSIQWYDIDTWFAPMTKLRTLHVSSRHYSLCHIEKRVRLTNNAARAVAMKATYFTLIVSVMNCGYL